MLLFATNSTERSLIEFHTASPYLHLRYLGDLSLSASFPQIVLEVNTKQCSVWHLGYWRFKLFLEFFKVFIFILTMRDVSALKSRIWNFLNAKKPGHVPCSETSRLTLVYTFFRGIFSMGHPGLSASTCSLIHLSVWALENPDLYASRQSQLPLSNVFLPSKHSWDNNVEVIVVTRTTGKPCVVSDP